MLRVEYREGLYLPDIDLWLDAEAPRERSVISHAHADHIAEHHSIISTPETARIFRHRRGDAAMETLRYGERRDYGRFALTFFPAGHCLGSAQVLIEAEGERLVYTGDIKLRPNVAAENAVEGCVRESYGAAVAAFQGECAGDLAVRRTMRAIARDEAQHAALGWDIDAWAVSRLSRAHRARLDEIREQARAALAGSLQQPVPAEVSSILGVPPAPAAARLAAAIARLR